MNASDILKTLRQNENLYLIANRGNKKLWFGTDIPDKLPISNQEFSVKIERFSPPGGIFKPVLANIAGWMSYDQHFDGKISSATAFILISPSDKSEPSVEFTLRKLPAIKWNLNQERLVYGLDGEYFTYFCSGIMRGLQTVLWHPVADIKVHILNAIIDTINSDLKAFENLGQWLTEALIVEMCRTSLIEMF
jgi:hypothetical protein